jgi:hypothetical protein
LQLLHHLEENSEAYHKLIWCVCKPVSHAASVPAAQYMSHMQHVEQCGSFLSPCVYLCRLRWLMDRDRQGTVAALTHHTAQQCSAGTPDCTQASTGCCTNTSSALLRGPGHAAQAVHADGLHHDGHPAGPKPGVRHRARPCGNPRKHAGASQSSGLGIGTRLPSAGMSAPSRRCAPTQDGAC